MNAPTQPNTERTILAMDQRLHQWTDDDLDEHQSISAANACLPGSLCWKILSAKKKILQ